MTELAGASTFVQSNCLQFVSHSCFFQEKPNYKYTDDCDQNPCMKTGCPDQGSKLYGFVNFRRLRNISFRVHQEGTDCIAKKINCNIIQHNSDNNFGNIEFRFAHCCDQRPHATCQKSDYQGKDNSWYSRNSSPVQSYHVSKVFDL